MRISPLWPACLHSMTLFLQTHSHKIEEAKNQNHLVDLESPEASQQHKQWCLHLNTNGGGSNDWSKRCESIIDEAGNAECRAAGENRGGGRKRKKERGKMFLSSGKTGKQRWDVDTDLSQCYFFKRNFKNMQFRNLKEERRGKFSWSQTCSTQPEIFSEPWLYKQ